MYDDHLAKIRAKREAIGMTQAEAAEAYGCPQPTWSVWETGRKPCSAEVLRRMAEVVGLRLSIVVTGK